ncbi:MAG: glycoside hydrolase family 97 N-terminal domain-containing protein, partial [Paramuribaculum sp.]|nr:glycoside hydrolase family 97 N-terminal domain-containing protein [Paramuribaculum sp.]
MRHIYSLAIAALISASSVSAAQYRLTSPDGHILFTLSNSATGATYSVSVNDRQLIEPSAMGLVAEGVKWDYKKAKVTRSSLDETWTQPWGENTTCRNHYNEMAVTLGRKSDLTIRVRAFDDGVA